jgi:hypothetical protein
VSEFNPRSNDAMFAKILGRLDSQDKKMCERLEAQDKFVEVRHLANAHTLDSILIQTKATNGRVTKLEKIEERRAIRWQLAVKVGAGVSTIAGAIWAVVSVFL